VRVARIAPRLLRSAAGRTASAMATPEEILAFWFPPGLDADEETHRRQFQWWFGGGANEAILAHYRPVLEAACRGELPWARTPRGRLALIIVLDQFSRTVWQGTAQAFAQDFLAQQLSLEGLECGHYAELATVWQKTFFVLPLGHAEQQDLLDRCVALCEALALEAPAHLQRLYAFSAAHRNAALGRTSTEEELAYLATGELVHRRSFRG
jgi:uncharacterized protein (DUF924 family)